MPENKKSTTDLNIDDSGLKTGEKFVYKYDDKNRVIETRKEKIPVEVKKEGRFSEFIRYMIIWAAISAVLIGVFSYLQSIGLAKLV